MSSCPPIQDLRKYTDELTRAVGVLEQGGIQPKDSAVVNAVGQQIAKAVQELKVIASKATASQSGE
ncbi:MAG: hypothetical protein WCX61_00810 [Candidatus Peribacteraceae bacterium]|jgi:hypothetical protein